MYVCKNVCTCMSVYIYLYMLYIHILYNNYCFLLLLPADEIGLYSLEIFSVLSSCLIQCWADGTYLSALVHRFWKLTLQVRRMEKCTIY